MVIFSPYARSFNGPTDPNTFEPPILPRTNLAASVPTPIFMKSFLFVLNAFESVFNPPLISPLMKDCAACPALAASKNANPAPVSNKFMLNVLRLRDLLAFLLGAIVAPDYPFAPVGATVTQITF